MRISVFSLITLVLGLGFSACDNARGFESSTTTTAESASDSYADELAAQRAAEAQAQAAEQARREAEELAARKAQEEKLRQEQMMAIAVVMILDDSLSKMIADRAVYAQRMARIPMENCPTDFQEAFLRHAFAWEDAAKVSAKLEEAKNATGPIFLADLGLKLFKDNYSYDESLSKSNQEKIDMLTTLRAQASDNITSTYREVQLLAVRYGVTESLMKQIKQQAQLQTQANSSAAG